MGNRKQSFIGTKFQRGFSLVELMIVVAIVGILSVIAYPSYVSYTVKANRAAAEAFILGVSGKQEQYLLDNRSYAPDLATLGLTAPKEVSDYYTVAIGGIGTAPPTYTVTATPTGTQATNDVACGSVSINQSGTKAVSGGAAVTSCW